MGSPFSVSVSKGLSGRRRFSSPAAARIHFSTRAFPVYQRLGRTVAWGRRQSGLPPGVRCAMITRISSTEYMLKDLAAGAYPHVVFLIGSVVSGCGPSPYAGVGVIKHQLVLAPLKRRLEQPVTRLERKLRDLVELISPAEGKGGEVAELVDRLPFELFMSCLDQADTGVAQEIIGQAVPGKEDFRPNRNHRGIAAVSRELLMSGRARTVTVLTTNYDRGLDLALRETFGRELDDVKMAPFPAWSLREGAGVLQYAKLHGCIRRHESLVFTFEKLAAGILQPEAGREFLARWIPAGGRTLVMACGYGFNDPDLRPVFTSCFGPDQASVLWTVVPRTLAGKDPGRFYGYDVLRNEFLGQLSLYRLESDLYRNDGANLIWQLQARLGCGIPAEPPESKYQVPPACTSGGMDRLELRQVLLFLARLLDAAYRNEAGPALREYLRGTRPEAVDPVLGDFFLHQYGHGHKMRAMERATGFLARRPFPVDLRVRALARCSQAISINESRGLLDRAFRPLVPLGWGGLLAFRASPEARTFWAFLGAHYAIKSLQQGLLMLPTTSVRPVGALIRWLPLGLAAGLARIQRGAEQQRDVRLTAQALDLRAQALVLTRRAGAALATARRAQELACALNAFHLVISLDRTMGWAWLAGKPEPDLRSAARAFARGLLRAGYAGDASWTAKLGMNFIRVVLAVKEAPFEGETLTPVKHPSHEVEQALFRFVALGEGTPWDWDDVRMIAESALAESGPVAVARLSLKRYGNLEAHPWFHFEKKTDAPGTNST